MANKTNNMKQTDDNKLEIYTDGSCLGNPGPGGYGAVLRRADGRVKEISGAVQEETTNNRMEMLAVIKALEQIKSDYAEVIVYSDSQLLVNAFNKGWIDKWRANGWLKADKKQVENRDLWQQLAPLAERHKVKFEWVPGHAGNEGNERANQLAIAAALAQKDAADAAKSGEPRPRQLRPGDLTHIDDRGAAAMVNVGDKPVSQRRAEASADIIMHPNTLKLIAAGEIPKGDALATARIAAINAAKRADELIPLCHQIPLNAVDVKFEPRPGGDGLTITTAVDAAWTTGVEMEALLAASVAALTIYDMCKAADKTMRIENLRLLAKTKRDFSRRHK